MHMELPNPGDCKLYIFISSEGVWFSCAGEVGCVQIGSEQVKVCWYDNAQSAQGAAWAALVFLVVFLIVSLIRLCIWGRRWKLKRQRQALQNYAQLEEEKPAAI